MPDRDLETEIADFLLGEDGSDLKGLRVDFAFGGGKCFFLPNGTDGSCRTDSTDLLARAKEKGINVVQGMSGLREYHEQGGTDGPVLGLFADDVRLQQASRYAFIRSTNDDLVAQHMDYEIDRQSNVILANEQPSLKEMSAVLRVSFRCIARADLEALSRRTTHALRYLTAKGEKGKRKGFFLMIEGSRIDMAACVPL